MTWTEDTLRSELLKLFRQHAQDGVDVKVESHLVADLGIDSLGVMEVVADIEDTFKLTIEDDALRQVDTVADVAAAIETKLRQGGRLAG